MLLQGSVANFLQDPRSVFPRLAIKTHIQAYDIDAAGLVAIDRGEEFVGNVDGKAGLIIPNQGVGMQFRCSLGYLA